MSMSLERSLQVFQSKLSIHLSSPLHIGYWWESQKERDHWEDQDVGGWTILKCILER
jgi:hypothetical protein